MWSLDTFFNSFGDSKHSSLVNKMKHIFDKQDVNNTVNVVDIVYVIASSKVVSSVTKETFWNYKNAKNASTF